jgi:hypothetical protein
METALRKTQEVSLTLFKLLHGNYDCMKLCINTLKETETSESRDYHKERHKSKKHSPFSSYSFLYTLKAAPWRNAQKKKMDNAKNIYDYPMELSHLGLYRILSKPNMIVKYDELLASPNLTTEQRNVILKMKEKRKTKIKRIDKI